MISLYKDPDGNKVFGKSIPGSSAAGTNTYSTQNVESLKGRIKELESLVATLNVSDGQILLLSDSQCMFEVISFHALVLL